MNSQELEVQICKEISLQEIAIEAKNYIDKAQTQHCCNQPQSSNRYGRKATVTATTCCLGVDRACAG